MDSKLRIVTHLPLRELWRDDGFRTTARGRSLTGGDIGALLTSGPMQFVVADVGTTLRWIPASESLRFWKDEAKPHLASHARAHLAEFPDGYCYFASQWEAELGTPIVALEKHH